MLALSVARFTGRGDGRFDFTRVAVDARGYLSLGSPQRVLAARVLATSDDPDEGARVPFYLMDSLANSHTLRGFQSLRFRDERLLSLQAEYRWEAAPAVELALFCDAGRASHGKWSLEDLETGYGVGLRVKSHEATLARFDVARSHEGVRLYVRFGAAF
jgi:outer membrane translocation and assembly module TamA